MSRAACALSILLAVTLTGCSISSGSLPPPFVVTTDNDSSTPVPRQYFVDGSLKVNPCPAYDPATRSCGSGSQLAFNNLEDANSMARGGDTIRIRGGHYSDPIRPEHSGTTAAPLTYRGMDDETATVTTAEEPALQLLRVHHIVIEGLHIDSSLGWGRLEDAHHNHIVGNTFTEAIARGTTGGLKLVRSHYNRVEGNIFHRGNDSIVVQDSGHNLITRNHLEFARHTLVSIRCGNYNIVRANYLHNERQKAAEIYDCEGVSDAPVRYDATKRNIFEYNHFAWVTGSSEPDNYNGIQYAAQAGIVRFNSFIDNQGGAIHLAIYPEEALYVYANRIYGNRFINNRCHAISAGSLAALRANDNRIQGNLFSGNMDCNGTGTRVARHPVYTLVDNLETGDAAAAMPITWVARALTAGAGTELALDDVLPFSDGHGIAGEAGDEVIFERSNSRARVRSIDFVNKTLTLDRSVTWAASEGLRVETASMPRPERSYHPQPLSE